MKPKHMAMLNEGKTTEVIPLLEAELKATPDDRQRKEDLALAYSQARRFTDAVQLYEDLLDVFPDDPRILVNVGLCYAQLNQTQQAFAAYTKVIDQSEVQAKVVYLEIASGKRGPDIVKGLGGSVIVELEVVSLAWMNLAALYEHYSYYEEAYARYRMAIQLNPENWLAKKYLEQLEELGDPDHGPIGIKRLPDGTEVRALWDGSFISQNRSRKIGYGVTKGSGLNI